MDLEALKKTLKANQKITPTLKPNCDICKDQGYLYGNRDGYLYVRKCKCQIQKEIQKNIDKSGLKTLFETKNFETFSVKNPVQKAIKNQCIANCDCQDSILLTGQVGSGKTHLAIAILNRLVQEGNRIKYVNYVDVMRELSQNAMDREAFYRLMHKLQQVKILMIDDLCKGKTTEAQLSYLYEIIDYRYINNLKTVITSEKSITEIINIDEAIGSRIAEMSAGYIVSMDAFENYRI